MVRHRKNDEAKGPSAGRPPAQAPNDESSDYARGQTVNPKLIREAAAIDYRTIEVNSQQSRVYERGQTVMPKKVRESLGVEEGSTLTWTVEDGVARVFVMPKDPVRALYGILKGKGPTFAEYLADRNTERERERKLEADQEDRWHS